MCVYIYLYIKYINIFYIYKYIYAEKPRNVTKYISANKYRRLPDFQLSVFWMQSEGTEGSTTQEITGKGIFQSKEPMTTMKNNNKNNNYNNNNNNNYNNNRYIQEILHLPVVFLQSPQERCLAGGSGGERGLRTRSWPWGVSSTSKWTGSIPERMYN